MAVKIGIDLGTTFSAVAIVDSQTNIPKIIPNSEGGKITPSIIQFADVEIIIGSDAEKAFNNGEEGCVSTFKRNMGTNNIIFETNEKSYTAEDLSELLLRHLKENTEKVLGDNIEEAVITVPAYFLSPEREATKRAAEKAGLKVKQLIDEPNAAALSYGLNNWRENANILVYDLGGGTFDVTIVRMDGNGNLKTITTRGDHILGGRDWDNRLQALLLDKFAEETELDTHNHFEIKMFVRGLAEGIKKQLTSMETTNVTAKLPEFGKATVTVTRDEFDNNTSDLLDKTGALCKAVLSEAGLTGKDISDILLVGGSTRMPQVSKYLNKMFGKNPITHVNPDEAVALGAAIQVLKQDVAYNKLMVFEKNGKKVTDLTKTGIKSHATVLPAKKTSIGVMTLCETTAHAMGIIAVNPEGTHYINDIIIPANHPRPVRVAKAFGFQTSSRSANEMEIFVLQGDKLNPLECLIPYKYVVSGIRHIQEQKGKTKIRVQYSYDNSGIINVEARQENDRTNLSIEKYPVPEDMSKYGLPIDQKKSKPEPISIILAVDVSGSMHGTPIEDAKTAMITMVRNQIDFNNTQVGIIAVADRSVIVCHLTDNEKNVINAINSVLDADAGGANSGHPFEDIKKMFKNKEGHRYAIILADGNWSCTSEAQSSSRECNALGIETSAIGFGGADYEFLRSISSSDSNAILVSQSELTQAFGSIAQSLGGSGSKTGNDSNASDTETWDS